MNSQKPNDANDELKQLDNLLFDILRSGGESPPEKGANHNNKPNNYNNQNGNGNKLVHIYQNNNADSVSRMRDTRDQFMVPKMG